MPARPHSTPTVSIADYRQAVATQGRLDSLDAARCTYAAYGAMLSARGGFSTTALVGSIARGLLAPAIRRPGATGSAIALYDAAGVNGLKTLRDIGAAETALDLRPSSLLRHFPPSKRAARLAALATVSRHPERFFARLFDVYAEATANLLGPATAQRVVTANERSIGCAPAVAVARYGCAKQVDVVQHGNPICDYLPTVAHRHLCRSDRWFSFVSARPTLAGAERIADFPTATEFSHAARASRVVLVMHNIGYLEPALDYRVLTQRMQALCGRSGRALEVLPHPSSGETFGLPAVERGAMIEAALFVGYRSTLLDQLPAGVPRVSLLDYWPAFFMHEGGAQDIEDFFTRIERTLS